MTDPNGNRTEVAFDALGMVVGTAVMGKPMPAPVEGDSLAGFDADLTEAVMLDASGTIRWPIRTPSCSSATTRLVYDLFAYQRTRDDPQPQPAVVYTLARETHDSRPRARRADRRSSTASPTPTASAARSRRRSRPSRGPLGRTGGAGCVRSALGRQRLDGLQQQGQAGPPVRAVLHRHPPLRVRRARRREPDAVLRPGRARRRDAAPQPHLGESRLRSLAAGDLGCQRHGADRRSQDRSRRRRLLPPPAGRGVSADLARAARWTARWVADEQAAARKAAVHAETPAVAHIDSLGRTFLTVAHNRFERRATLRRSADEEFHARASYFDIEGNQREVIDAHDRIVMRYDYDMLGSRIHQPAWRPASAGC